MDSAIKNNPSLKYQGFTPCKDIGIKKCELVAKTQFLSKWVSYLFHCCKKSSKVTTVNQTLAVTSF